MPVVWSSVELDIKGGWHYTASQLLAGFDLRNTAARLATVAVARPRCGTTPTQSPRLTGGPPPTSPS
jgi:hypothetical protein